MSTTIPLTLIEGSMALPRVSPFGRQLPAPFGRDWALLPPGRSLRAELKALYAAMLRTFCVSERTIHSFCNWEPLSEWTSARAGVAGVAGAATVSGAPLDEAAQTCAEAAAFTPVSAPAFETAPSGTPIHWGTLAGGACAFGGAAILAWIAFGHLTQHHTTSDVETTAKSAIRQETPLANRHSPDDAVTPYATANSRVAALAPSAASSHAHVAGASGSVPASPQILPNALAATPLRDFPASSAAKIVAPVTATPARTMAGSSVSRRGDKQRKGAVTPHERKSGGNSRVAISTQLSPRSPPRLSHIKSTHHEVPPITESANTQRTSSKPSSAGPYSPLAPSQLGTGEYTSITLSARTHLPNIAPPSRPASSINPSAIGATEWINHMSQRRVTETPDQFTK